MALALGVLRSIWCCPRRSPCLFQTFCASEDLSEVGSRFLLKMLLRTASRCCGVSVKTCACFTKTPPPTSRSKHVSTKSATGSATRMSDPVMQRVQTRTEEARRNVCFGKTLLHSDKTMSSHVLLARTMRARSQFGSAKLRTTLSFEVLTGRHFDCSVFQRQVAATSAHSNQFTDTHAVPLNV